MIGCHLDHRWAELWILDSTSPGRPCIWDLGQWKGPWLQSISKLERVIWKQPKRTSQGIYCTSRNAKCERQTIQGLYSHTSKQQQGCMQFMPLMQLGATHAEQHCTHCSRCLCYTRLWRGWGGRAATEKGLQPCLWLKKKHKGVSTCDELLTAVNSK